MTTLVRLLFTLAAPCLFVLAAGTGCAVAVDAPPEPEHVRTVTSGTFTVEDGEDAGTSTVATPDGGAIVIPSIDGGGDAGGDPLGS